MLFAEFWDATLIMPVAVKNLWLGLNVVGFIALILAL
jgi:hypothetical protein